MRGDASLPVSWQPLAGWSSFAGRTLDLPSCDAALDDAEQLLRDMDWCAADRLAPSASPAATVREGEANATQTERARPRGTLLGYGNYAKIAILPNVRDYVSITRIHEIDPLQMPLGDRSVTWDTSPQLSDRDAGQVVFIAGFHHTHAPIAVEALRRGAYAVAEKPVVTDRAQVRALTDAMRSIPRFFACFHKRYSPFNAWAREDLQAGDGDPISYHCVVYEVPLPARHWYRWPSSRSRLVSNGCHWLDHFLFLNHWSPVSRRGLDVARNGTLSVWAELENGAYFTMVLTDLGSERIGVQDYIELRANGRTVRMTNGSRYEAEDGARILRRVRRNKMESYARMYRSIAEAVARGEDGDSVESVERSCGLVLDLEAELDVAR
jgi:predicted dehydrogenase